MSKNSIPKNFKSIFWDVNLASLDFKVKKAFVIERIINKGDFEHIKWMIENYTLEEIKNVVHSSYNVSTNAVNIWGRILNINPELCQCTRRPLHLRVFD